MENIADRYAQVKLQIEALEEELKVIKSKAEATGLDVIDGDQFRLTMKEQGRSSLDRKVLEQWLSAEQLEEATKTTLFTRFTYKAIFKVAA
jgi:hypothetical protein